MMRLLLISLLVAFSMPLFATNGLSPIGYGVQSKGMGGASVAFPQDGFIIAVNPAGLVNLGSCLDVELSSTIQEGNYQGINRGLTPTLEVRSTSSQALWWPGIAVALRISPCLSVGIASYILGANDQKWDPPLVGIGNPPFPGFSFQTSEMQNYFVAITPGIAWRCCSDQTLGISGDIVVGTLNVKGVARLLPGSSLPSFVSDNGVDSATGIAFRIGWLGTFFCDQLKIGAALRTKTFMSRFSKYQGLLGDYGALQWPWNGTLGFAWTFCPCWVLAVDFQYIQWRSVNAAYFSEYANQVNRNNGSRGLWDGQGLGWDNQGVAKVGIAWTPCNWLTLRAGYNYNTALIAGSELLLGSLVGGFIRHHVTVGATFSSCLGKGSVYYLHGLRHSVRSHGGLSPPDDLQSANVSNRQDEVGLAWSIGF